MGAVVTSYNIGLLTALAGGFIADTLRPDNGLLPASLPIARPLRLW